MIRPTTLVTIAAAALLAACASPAEPTGYRDTSGAARADGALRADAAQCDYEIRRSRHGAPWIPPAMMQSCLSARGWQAVYR